MAASGRWVNHGERVALRTEAYEVSAADVSTPGGRRVRVDVVRANGDETACLATDPAQSVLLVWRQRFIIDGWAWELPSVQLRNGEDALAGAVRCVRDDCGWSVAQPRVLWSMARWPQHADVLCHLVLATARGAVTTPSQEVTQVGWFDRSELRRVLGEGEVHDAVTVAALCWWLAWEAAPQRPA